MVTAFAAGTDPPPMNAGRETIQAAPNLASTSASVPISRTRERKSACHNAGYAAESKLTTVGLASPATSRPPNMPPPT